MDSNLPPENNPPPLNTPLPPPPYAKPPPIIMPPSAPLRVRTGTGWKVFAFVTLALLLISVLFNFTHFVSGMTSVKGRSYRSYGPRLEEVLIRDNASDNKIAVIDVDGVISGEAVDQGGFSMVSVIKEELKRARKDRQVKAVILRVNSPGGEVLASDEIAKAISQFQEQANKPVVVSMGSLAASGGYYVSAPCDWIVANELTITGSIGVIMHGFNYRGLMDKLGVRPEVYKSGKFKDMMSGTKSEEEISPEERKMVQDLIDETFGKFKEVVKVGRTAAHKGHEGKGKALAKDWESYADGRILSGKQALDLGFVDELGDFEVAVKRAKDLAHLSKSDASVVQYQPIFELSNLFHLFGQTDAKSVKVDLGMDVPKLKAGYLYFMSPTYLH